MNNYGYCIFEDQSGNSVESEQGYSSIAPAREAAENARDWWTDSYPHGSYSWDVYDVVSNETIEVSQ